VESISGPLEASQSCGSQDRRGAIEGLLRSRDEAKAAKNYPLADEIASTLRCPKRPPRPQQSKFTEAEWQESGQEQQEADEKDCVTDRPTVDQSPLLRSLNEYDG